MITPPCYIEELMHWRVLCYFIVMSADAVSVTSSDSSDSVQLPAIPSSSSSSSTVSEDCSAQSGQRRPSLLLVSIDLELLRKDEPIVELVTPPVHSSPEMLQAGSAAEPMSDSEFSVDANDLVYNTAENSGTNSAESCITAENVVERSEIGDRTCDGCDDDFESIYSRKTALPMDQVVSEMSLDDSIMRSLMTSDPDEFRNVVRSVSFHECPGMEFSNDSDVNSKSSDAVHRSTGHVAVPQSTQDANHISHPSSVSGSRQSMVVNGWLQLPAPANIQSLSVTSQHVWCVDMLGRTLYSRLCGPGLRWFVVTTAPAQQVSVSPTGSLVWRLDHSSAFAACGVSTRHPWGTKWTEVARNVSWISVDDHVAWYVTFQSSLSAAVVS